MCGAGAGLCVAASPCGRTPCGSSQWPSSLWELLAVSGEKYGSKTELECAFTEVKIVLTLKVLTQNAWSVSGLEEQPQPWHLMSFCFFLQHLGFSSSSFLVCTHNLITKEECWGDSVGNEVRNESKCLICLNHIWSSHKCDHSWVPPYLLRTALYHSIFSMPWPGCQVSEVSVFPHIGQLVGCTVQPSFITGPMSCCVLTTRAECNILVCSLHQL